MEPPAQTTRVSVLLPYKFDTAFTYAADEPLPPGTLVRVPLGSRVVAGAVWDDKPDMNVKVKPIAGVYAFPPLPETNCVSSSTGWRATRWPGAAMCWLWG